MPPITDAQATAIVKRGADILEEAGRLTSGTDPNYIRDAQPDSIFEAIPLAAARQGCRRYADKGSNYPGRRGARAERACRPYLDSLAYGTPPSLISPFPGGQCVGVGYFVYPEVFNVVTGSWDEKAPLIIYGPITGRQIVSLAQFNQRWEVSGSSQSGQPTTSSTTDGVDRASARWGKTTTFSGGPADDCGDPPPEYFPPTPPAIPGPPREPFKIAPNIDVNIGVEVNIDGSISIDIGTGPITIDPFDEPPEPTDPGGGGGGDDPLPPGFQGEPDAPIDVAPGDAADETADVNLVGVLVQVIEKPPRVNRLFNQTESYDKGCYYVYFGGDGGLSINPDAALVRTDQFFYAPPGCNRFRVIPNNGFALRVTPYYEE